MSIWMSVAGPDDQLATALDYSANLPLDLFLDVASSLASEYVRIICDLDAECHIRNKQPFSSVCVTSEVARELARQLVIAADRTELP